MTEKKKKNLMIATGVLICTALAVGIAARSDGGSSLPQDELTVPSDSAESGSPSITVEISGTDPIPEIHVEEPEITASPGVYLDSIGTDQSIQATPQKPSHPEPPEPPVPSARKDTEHSSRDVPESERNAPVHPEYVQPPRAETPSSSKPAGPAPGSTNSSGQVYVPGFGYVRDSGANQGDTLNDMYENGNKIGIMG